jgi:sugar/nucleoside kinase (ribokinase family)
MAYDVCCVGILVADLVGKPVRDYPKRGELVQVERMELHVGGCASNTGLVLGKLGVNTVVVGKVGSDPLGDFVVGELQKHHVHTTGVQRDRDIWTASTMVMVHPDGERSFIHHVGANGRFCLNDVEMEVVRRSKILHVAGAFLMPAMDGQPSAELLKRAREMGVITCLDTAWDTSGQWMETLHPCLPHLDYFVPSYEEAKQLAGRTEPETIADVFLSEGVGTVALKMSAEGCYIKNSQTARHFPAYKVNAIDELGAGDCFAAGFLAGLAKGWNIERTAQFANAVGALCVTALGATTGIRSLEETLKWMKHMEEKS